MKCFVFTYYCFGVLVWRYLKIDLNMCAMTGERIESFFSFGQLILSLSDNVVFGCVFTVTEALCYNAN